MLQLLSLLCAHTRRKGEHAVGQLFLQLATMQQHHFTIWPHCSRWWFPAAKSTRERENARYVRGEFLVLLAN
jgi:hypothetical protein